MTKPGNWLKGWGLGLTLFFCLVSNQHLLAQEQIFGSFKINLVSEVEPLKTTYYDWGSDFKEGQRQWGTAYTDLGIRFTNNIEFSIFKRVLVDLRLNEESVALYGKIARKETLTPNQQVPVNININGFTGEGIRVGYRYQQPSWQVSLGISTLTTSHLMNGELNGTLKAIDSSSYSLNAEVDYVYYRDPIFRRPNIKEASGHSWVGDIKLSWQPIKQLQLDFTAEDLFTKIKWSKAPYTRAKASTDQKSYTDEGYLKLAPLFTGREGYKKTFYQEIDPRFYASATYNWASWSATLRGQYQFDYGFVGAGIGYNFAPTTKLTSLYWPKHNLLGLELEQGKWKANFAMSHLEFHKVHNLSLGFSYAY